MAGEKLVFQIGFDLDSAVKDATSEWKRVQRELEAAINARPISISMDTKGLERFNAFVERTYASLEDLQDLFPEVFKETKDGEGITKRFQAMETSINAVSKGMRNLEKVWNNLSQAEKFDDDGNLTERAQKLKRAYVELYQSQKTQGQTLQEITKEAINLANQEYEAQQRKKKQEEDFIRLLNLEETTLEKLQAKQGAWKQKLSQTEIGTSDWSDAIAEVQRLETKIKDLQKQIKGVATETKKTSKTKVDIDTSTFAGKLKDLENRWKALNAEQRKGAEGQALRSEWRKLSEEAGSYNSTLRSAVSAEDRLANAKKKTTKVTHEQNKAYKTQETYLKRLAKRMIAYAGVHQVFSFLRNIREVTAEFELQRVALGSIIGDLNEANKMFEQIKAAAVKSPFQIKELVTYTKQLAAYKIGTDELFETTQRLADISAGLGVSMDRLVLAYGQIRATGYLRASEVRQLTEAGIPIVEELAQKMSQLRGETVSAAEVMGMISERAISFSMVKEVFEDMTSAGGMFYKMQEKQAETLRGQWSNLQDSVAIMYEEIGNTESVNYAMTSMIGLLKSLAQNWQDVGSIIASLGASFSVYYIAMKNATVASKALTASEARLAALEMTREARMPRLIALMLGQNKAIAVTIALNKALVFSQKKALMATTLLGKAFWKLTTAMLSNPYTAVLAAIAGIATWLLTASDNADRLNKELDKISTEGAIQADQSVRNFERLAKTIRESADGSREQSEALAELKRTYGDLLPMQDKEILALVKVKEGYEDVTTAIREKIDAQIYEQKMNKIISDYGSRIDETQKRPKELLKKEGYTENQITDIFIALDKAVQDGTINFEQTISERMEKIKEVIYNATGKILEDELAYLTASQGGVVYTATTKTGNALNSLIAVQTNFKRSIKQLADSQKQASNITWEYKERYDKLKESIAKTNAQFDANTFAGSESIKANTLEKWREYFVRLSDVFDKTPKGGIIDFKSLEDEIKKLPANLRAHIRVVQKEYEKLIPTDTNRLIRMKFEEYASEVGISMDKVSKYLKTNETTTKDWAKNIDNSIKSLKSTLAEYRLDQEEGYAKHGTPFRDMTEDIQDLEKEIKLLELIAMFFKDLFSTKTKKTNPRIAQLNEELSTVEKIYKEYQELRKVMSDTKARANIENMFKGVNFKILSRALSPTEMRKEIEKALKEARKLGDKKQILELEYRLGKFDVDEEQRKLEESLKDLSDKISRTKTAKEFFDRMLGMTGDKQLSASLTVSIYGGEMRDDLGKRLAEDMATKFQEQVQTYFGDIDISSAINNATGEIDPIKLEKLLTKENIDKIGKDNVIKIRKIINDLIKANADYATELFKSYEKFFDYEKRMTMVTQREEEERKKIRESMIPDDQKEQLQKASKKREQEQISAIEIEQIKDTADWEKTFEDLNNLGSLTVKNLISLLEDYIAKKKKAGEPIAESDMKTLMNELNQLRERYAQLDPFATIKASLKDLTDATKEYNEAKKDKDEKKMANAQNKRAKALNKLETAVNAVASGFQNLSNLLTEFQELLGIEDDSAVGEVFNGAAKALGVVATALSAAIALTLLWNSTLWANPLFAGVAIVSGVLGAIAGVFSAIANAKVRRANKEIERQQKLLDQFTYSYERLEKAVEKSFGTDYISNYEKQIANLEAQQRAYLKQAEAERSKGKKADEDKIKEYTEKARDAADSIADMRSNISEYFLGTDLTSAARDFANAWIEAYKEFGSTTDAMKEKFQDMIQNMIVESFAAKVIQSELQPIFDSIDEMSKDGMLDMSEASKIADMTEVAVGNIDAGMSVVMKALSKAGISVRDVGTELTGISRNIATASEESILGLAAGINTQNFYISQVPPKLDVIIGLLQGGSQIVGDGVNMQDLVTIQNQHLAYLPNIAQNTADTVARCERAALACERVADNLDRVIKPRGTQSSYTLNTSL